MLLSYYNITKQSSLWFMVHVYLYISIILLKKEVYAMHVQHFVTTTVAVTVNTLPMLHKI